MEFVTDARGTKIKFPFDGVEYKDVKFKVMREITSSGIVEEPVGPTRRVEAVSGSGENRTSLLGTPTINPDDLATLLPFLLNERDRLMIQVVLTNHFHVVGHHDRKATALALFMNWTRTIDPTSESYNMSIALGRELLNSLRVASISANTRTPEQTVNARLDTATTEDPLTRVAAELQRQNVGRRNQGANIFRGGNSRGFPGTGKSRACKYCGELHNRGWDSHDCSRWCSRCKKPKSPGDNHKC